MLASICIKKHWKGLLETSKTGYEGGGHMVEEDVGGKMTS